MGKKDFILFISIFCVLALISGSTFAYWQWQADTNKTVAFNTSHGIEKYITYNAGTSHFVGNFQPSTNYCNNTVYNTISFNKNSIDLDVTLKASIKMDVNSIASSLKSSYVHWVVINGEHTSCTGDLDDAVAHGTFVSASSGGVIELLKDIPVVSGYLASNSEEDDGGVFSPTVYTIYIWVDSAGSSSAMSGETLDVNIWTQFDQVANLLGDVNMDGKISTIDVRLILQYIDGSLTNEFNEISADVNLDGVINDSDSSILELYVAGIITSLPYTE